jgi:FkbM family methyltransferase
MRKLSALCLIAMSSTFLHTQYYSQIDQDKFVHQLFGNLKNRIFVDIGAHDGISYSNTYFFEKNLDWKGICVEPNPDQFAKLVKNRLCACVQACVANFSGKALFQKITGNPGHEWASGLSGLVSKYDNWHLNSFGNFINQNTSCEYIEVDCLPIADILDQYGIRHIDYLSMDTEGGELEILKSIDYNKYEIVLIDVENNSNDPAIAEFLKTKNFSLIKKIQWDDIYVNNKYLAHQSITLN